MARLLPLCRLQFGATGHSNTVVLALRYIIPASLYHSCQNPLPLQPYKPSFIFLLPIPHPLNLSLTLHLSHTMTTTYAMPYIFEDLTGELTGSEFVDLNGRLYFRLHCTLKTPERTAYMIYDMTSTQRAGRGGVMVPVACLDFGANNALGTVSIRQGPYIEMERYLSRVARKCVDRHSLTWSQTELRLVILCLENSLPLMGRRILGLVKEIHSVNGRYVSSSTVVLSMYH